MNAEKMLNDHHAPSEVWVTHYALDVSEPERQWLDYVSTKPWPADFKAPITEWAANTRFVRADLATVSARVRVKPLVWVTFGKECLRAETVLGRYEVMWGFHNGQTSLDIPAPRRSHVWHPTLEAAKAAAQADYESRILAAIEPQPDPRDEVIARLVEALDELADLTDDLVNGVYTPDSFTSQPARAAIAAVKGGGS